MDFHFECDANVNSHSFIVNSHCSFRFVRSFVCSFICLHCNGVRLYYNVTATKFLLFDFVPLSIRFSPKLQNKLPLTNASPCQPMPVHVVFKIRCSPTHRTISARLDYMQLIRAWLIKRIIDNLPFCRTMAMYIIVPYP